MATQHKAFEVTCTADAHRNMWTTYADFRLEATRLDVRKLLWRLIAIVVLNAAFYIATQIPIFIWLILISFPLFAIFMRLSYRRARKAQAGILKWLEENPVADEQLSYTATDETIAWTRKGETTTFAWKTTVYHHEKDNVLMLFDGKSNLLFLLSKAVLKQQYESIKTQSRTHTKELLQKTFL